METIVQLLLPRKQQNLEYKGINIKGIKFPCLCTFVYNGDTYNGIIMKGWDGTDIYELNYASQQEGLTRLYDEKDLMALLEQNKIELKEGEIVFYD